jgi:hypothetical protein
MVASGHWTVVYSCDSTAVGVGPANDKWITYSNVICSAPGVAHSWIVLQNTDLDVSGTFQLCIDQCHTPSTARTYSTIYCSHQGYNNNGSTTNRPTAIGSECLVANDQGYMSNAASTIRINLLTSSDGQCTRLIFTAQIGLSYAVRPWVFDRLKNPPSWLTHPYIVSCVPRSGTGDYNYLYEADCIPTFVNYNSTSGSARTYHDSSSVFVSFATLGIASNYLETDIGKLANFTDGSYSPHPVIVCSVMNTIPGFLGEMYDLYWLPSIFGDRASGFVGGPFDYYPSPLVYLPSTQHDLGFFSHGVWLYGNDGNGGLF